MFMKTSEGAGRTDTFFPDGGQKKTDDGNCSVICMKSLYDAISEKERKSVLFYILASITPF